MKRGKNGSIMLYSRLFSVSLNIVAELGAALWHFLTLSLELMLLLSTNIHCIESVTFHWTEYLLLITN